MTAISPSSSDIQVEALQFRGAGSESAVQMLGSGIQFLLAKIDEIQGIARTSPVPASLSAIVTELANHESRISALESNAQKITLVGTYSYNAHPSSDDAYVELARHQLAYDGTLRLQRFTGISGSYTRTTVLDTGVSMTSSQWSELLHASTSANLFWQIRIFGMVNAV